MKCIYVNIYATRKNTLLFSLDRCVLCLCIKALSIADTTWKWVGQRCNVTLKHCPLSNPQDLFTWDETLRQDTGYFCQQVSHWWHFCIHIFTWPLNDPFAGGGSMHFNSRQHRRFQGAFMFYEIKLSLAEIFWAMASFHCCPWFFQRFKYVGCSWGPTNRWKAESYSWHHHHHHHPF